jgi:hypothetical protein
MNRDDLKNAFNKRLPKYLPETFFIERSKVINILETLRNQGFKKENEEVKENIDGENIFKKEKDTLFEILLLKSKEKPLKDQTINEMIEIIKEWNTSYHPTNSDYKRLAENIFNLFEKETILLPWRKYNK